MTTVSPSMVITAASSDDALASTERLVADRRWLLALVAVAPAWIAARAAVLGAYVLARVAVDQLGVARPAPLLDGVMAWDANQYRLIAEQGYDAVPHAYRFFPLFPLLVRWMAPLTFGSETAAALVLANGAALLLGMALYRLVVHETGDEGAGRLSTWFLLACPAAAPFVMGYAESLGAAASVLAILAARRGRWWWAGLAGAVVGITWSAGWLLVVPLLVEAVRGAREASWPSRLARAAAVSGPLVMSAAYLWWVDVATGDGWGNVVTVQTTVFDRAPLDPFRALYRAGEDLFVGHHASGLVLPWALLAIVLAVVAFQRLPASYGAYLTVVLLVTISSRNIDSSERYLLRAFPLVMAGSLLLRREWQQRLAVTLGLGGLVIYTTAIFLGAKVP